MSESVRSFQVHRSNVSSVMPLLLWENPVKSGLTLFELMVVIMIFQSSDMLRFVLRSSYFFLGAILLVEFVTKFLNGGKSGLISSFKPSRSFFSSVSREGIQSRSSTIASVCEEIVYWIKRAFDAQDMGFTLFAFIAAFGLYILSFSVPVSSLLTLCLIGAFTIPALSIRCESQISYAKNHISGLATGMTSKHFNTLDQKMAAAPPVVKYVYGGIKNRFGGNGAAVAAGAGALAGGATAATAAAALGAADAASIRSRAPSVMSFRAPSVHEAPVSKAASIRSSKAPSVRSVAPSIRSVAPSVHSVAPSVHSIPLSKAGSIRSAASSHKPAGSIRSMRSSQAPMGHDMQMQPTPMMQHPGMAPGMAPEMGQYQLPPGMTPEMYQAHMQHQAMLQHQAMMANGGMPHPGYEGSIYSGYTGSYTDSMTGSYVSRKSNKGHA